MVKNLKKLRIQKGISQQKLACELGVSQQSINKYENHNVEPDIATLISMADYFDVTLDFLVGRNEKEHAPKKGVTKKFFELNSNEQTFIDTLIEEYIKNKNQQ